MDLVENIVSLYKDGNWKEIIDKFHDIEDRGKVLWVFPSEDNIRFVGNIIKSKNLQVISVGCGSGLLEWILSQALDITITCVEIDGAWWNCKYAPPQFMDLHFAKSVLDDDRATQLILNNNQAALLFCYFNNREAFEKYMRLFTGNILIIIGPGEGRYTHTDPLPFQPELNAKWRLHSYQEVRSSKDYIVVYNKIIVNGVIHNENI